MTSTKIRWTTENIYYLLHSMKGFQPYGVEKHFHMMFILEKFRTKSGLNVTADVLWDYIREELYNIDVLEEGELELLRKKPVEYSIPADFKLER